MRLLKRIMELCDGRTMAMIGSPEGVPLNYAEKVRALAEKIPKGSTDRYDFLVKHDSWCPALSGGGCCTCDPGVTMRKIGRGEAEGIN